MELSQKLSKKTMIINAINIHSGGGLTILEALLEETKHLDKIIFIDSRAKVNFEEKHQVIFVKPKIKDRLVAEYKISKIVQKNDILFSAGNLPPIFQCRGLVYVYIHNIFLFDKTHLIQFDKKIRLRLWVETYWLKVFFKKEYKAIVQTKTMQKLFKEKNGFDSLQIPLNPNVSRIKLSKNIKISYDFCYIANYLPHKNHKNLLDAWSMLAEEKIFPSLALTITPKELEKYLINSSSKLKNTHIYCLGNLPHEASMKLLTKSNCLIYPSISESYGLPLVEAFQLNKPIVASEKDFIRDLSKPQQTFDPMSPLSISRAVKRFLNISTTNKQTWRLGSLFD